MEELFDLCDERGRLLGRSKPRSLVHRDGDWHRAFHCWVFDTAEDGDVRILLQLRAPDKDTCPNLWDVSVGGHYSAGEGIEGGLREMREELGLEVQLDQLVQAGWRQVVAFYADGLIDREVQDVFFLRRTSALDEVKPDPGEVPAVALVPGRALRRLASGRPTSVAVPGGEVQADRTLKVGELTLSCSSLVPGGANYYDKAVRFARRLSAGRRPMRRRWW